MKTVAIYTIEQTVITYIEKKLFLAENANFFSNFSPTLDKFECESVEQNVAQL